jgi:hypothetical protein
MEEVNDSEVIVSNKNINLNEVQNENVDTDDESGIDESKSNVITQKKTELICTLEAYHCSIFGERILQKYPTIFNALHELTEEELNERLNSVKILIQQGNYAKITQQVWKPITYSYEGLTKLLGFNTTGIAKILSEQQDTLEILEEIRLKYFSTKVIEPEYRLITSLIYTTLAVHSMNNATLTKTTVEIQISNHLDQQISNKEVLEKLL